MFRLNKDEWESIKFQVEELEKSDSLRSQIVTLKSGRGQQVKFLPYAFTEHVVAMLSGTLNSSDKAVRLNIAILRAFIEMRRFNIIHTDWKEQIRELKNYSINEVGQHAGIISTGYHAPPVK
jgi:hypothetical protein